MARVVACEALIKYLLYSYQLLEAVFGGYFADNSGRLRLLLAACTQTGLFAAFCLPAFYLCRKRGVGLRCLVVIALTAAYVGFWLGWTFWLYDEMARTGKWL
jgi:hypothetical protein